MASQYLEIDISEAQETISKLKENLSQDQFNRLMYRVFKRTGERVKTIVKRDLKEQYHVTPTWVGSQIGAPRMSFGGNGQVGCSIPIKGQRASIGGRYSATGGAHGWNALHRKRYKISAKVVKGQTSTLPATIKSMGNQPPFRNLGSKLGKAAFTRKGKSRLPIVPVVGIAVPQMPMNRSREDVQEDIMETLMKRMEHEYEQIIARCR